MTIFDSRKGVRVVLSEEKLKGVFRQHDKNGDGRLDKAELKEAFKCLGAFIPWWRAAGGLDYADANGDGFITEDEMTCLVKYASQFGYTIKMSSESMTKNGDGRLDKAEILKETFKRLEAIIPEWRAARVLYHADANGDGYITDEVMTGVVKYAIQFGYSLH
ncbi:hypothetical protein ACH5RR_035031 [Cinchona calisaya]|uniref:EF-hand domain-containing protein n=1 Tax=Cinchona calisaya TaxID=153742 RepID=A0ABD2YD19_9GENT